jgi:hypothetical protein
MLPVYNYRAVAGILLAFIDTVLDICDLATPSFCQIRGMNGVQFFRTYGLDQSCPATRNAKKAKVIFHPADMP